MWNIQIVKPFTLGTKGRIMMGFSFFSEQEELKIERIKEITKRIVQVKFKNNTGLTETEKELGNEITRTSFSMFSKRKVERKSTTVCNNSFLKNIKIDDDDDGISEKDLPDVESFLNNNTEAFHELVAQCFVSKTAKLCKTDNQLFYISIESKYSSKKEDIFFVNKRGKFVVFSDRVTDMPLEEYISDYFGNIDTNLQSEINKIKLDYGANHEDLQDELTKTFKEMYVLFSNEQDFQEGVITFFDFLGWKGLWLSNNGTPLKDVSLLIEDFREKLKYHTAELLPQYNNIEISKLISISDTIALFTPKVASMTRDQLLDLHALMARYILEQSVIKQYPIRGAITYGKYNFMNNVMIGPGIDECASWHEKCDWIGAHFTPSAQFVLNDSGIDRKENIMCYKQIPTKNGVPRVNYCIRWKVEKTQFQSLLDNVKALVPEIASKYMNTYNFLYT